MFVYTDGERVQFQNYIKCKLTVAGGGWRNVTTVDVSFSEHSQSGNGTVYFGVSFGHRHGFRDSE